MKISYKSVEQNHARDFLIRNNATKESISIRPLAQNYIGAFMGNTLIGIIGKTSYKTTNRIKHLYVLENYRKNGIGCHLVEQSIDYSKTNSAFATTKSKGIFKKYGFFTIHTNKNNISFLKKGV